MLPTRFPWVIERVMRDLRVAEVNQVRGGPCVILQADDDEIWEAEATPTGGNTGNGRGSSGFLAVASE